MNEMTWTSAQELLPDDDVIVLVATKARQVWEAYHDADGWVNPDDGQLLDGLNAVTHWMPLPEAP